MGRSRKAQRSSQVELRPPTAIRALQLLGMASIGGALALALLLLTHRVWTHAGETLEAPVSVEIVWPLTPDSTPDQPKTWLSAYFRDRLLATAHARAAESPDPVRGDAVARVGRAMEASGWFDGAPRVVRRGDGTIVVSGSWRTPACVVRHNGRDHLVDWRSRPMPATYDAGASGLRIIHGASSPPPRNAKGTLNYAEAWPGDDIRVGVETLRLLLAQPYANQVAGVDVRDYFVTRRIDIVTDKGTRVVWGGPPGEFIPGEASTKAKLDRLAYFASLAERGRRIDLGQQRLEIYNEDAVYADLTAIRR
ncbi:MAG: hypothetical protein DYG93_01690 [Leptolyngbya sp. PLA2]|nr:hypothetical protein [Leptolyngbya sp. PL-A2]MCQ3941071.1 hypothetical protein [cyanobacterium CYA1]MCZ7633065.1 hypothetical protein [Phycisphaerales bacterium]MDL1905664.1 hypothetical protein [Synechococcales cyanobacterium CNB]GIK18875.1 MAG: hypothetical protein BroJett004_10390 [Planctomycetota bacterium]